MDLGLAAALSLAQGAAAQTTNIIFDDDFEIGSLVYWTVTGSSSALDVTSAANGFPAAAVYSAYLNSSLDRMYHNISEVTGWSVFTFYLCDNTATRAFCELRGYTGEGYNQGTLLNVIAIGKYNGVTMPGEVFDSTKYQGRVVYGTSNGWFSLNAPGAPSRSPGWHRFDIVRTAAGDYNFYVDGVLGRAIAGVTDCAWDCVILGSIGAGSTAGDAWFDGVRVGTITPPPTLPIVTNLFDSGPGSLRAALAVANNGQTVDATGVSGTITLTSGELVVSNSVSIAGPGPGALTVSGNHASRVFAVTAPVVAFSGLTIANGQSAQSGAGIHAVGGPGNVLTIDHCILTNNTAAQTGGGIFNGAGTALTLIQSVVAGNSAAASGGGIYNDQGTLTVTGSLINSNTAYYGAGIYSTCAGAASVTVTIQNSTFSGNNSAGIQNDGAWGGAAAMNVYDSTFSGNAGAAILTDGRFGGNASLQLGNNLFKAPAGSASLGSLESTVMSAGYNLSSDAAGGDGMSGPGGLLNHVGDIRNTDPMLGSLQGNGGPTPTHALLSGSPAIDQGHSFGLGTDQRGIARPVNFAGIPNAAGGDGSDIGAFEVQIVPAESLPVLSGAGKAGDTFQFTFTNTAGASFTVFSSTNLALPLTEWTLLGVPIELAPGSFQFTDPLATNSPRCFYRVTSP
ncbi:MAG: right-handed parallel beta-helix repeat-containing protein [Verrucomicrobiota bacterium]